MSIPADLEVAIDAGRAFGDTRTRVLLAVLAGHRGCVDLGIVTGLRSTDTVYKHLLALRDEGLIAFEPKRVATGTLRPLVARVA